MEHTSFPLYILYHSIFLILKEEWNTIKLKVIKEHHILVRPDSAIFGPEHGLEDLTTTRSKQLCHDFLCRHVIHSYC